MRALTFILCMLLPALSVVAQNANSPHEGLCAELSTTPGNVSIRWWGKAGRTYFVQTSETLLPGSWSYLPTVEAGADVVKSLGMPAPSDKLFVRLVYTDASYTGDVAAADFDHDGLTNAEELALDLRTDPLSGDTDRDGAPDGVETRQNSDPRLAAIRPSKGDPERFGYAPSLMLGRQTRHATNSWNKTQNAEGDPVFSGTLFWQSPSQSTGNQSYNEYSPRYEQKLAEPSMAWLTSGLTSYSVVSFATGSCLWRHSIISPGVTESNYASINDAHVFLRTLDPAVVPQWEIPRYVMIYEREGSEKPPYNYSYNTVKLQTMTVGPTYGASYPVELAPRPVKDRGTTKAIGMLSLDSNAGLGLDSVTSHNIIPQLDPWIMLPVGGNRTVNVNNGAGNDDSVYELVDGGLPSGLLTSSPIALSSTSTTNTTGVLRAGYRASGGTPVFADTPLLKVAVYEKLSLNINIIPVGYSNGSGSDIPPSHLPSAAAVKSFLDSVFLTQANIDCNVVIKPVLYPDWDSHGVGLNPDDETYGVNDGAFTFTYLPNRSDITTYEETMLFYDLHFTHSVISTSPTTLNVLWIVAPQGMYQLDWELFEDQGDWGDILYYNVLGYSVGDVRWFGNFVYVRDTAPPTGEPNFTSLSVLAHEIGHALGLSHCTETWSLGYSRFSDTENRLMTGRFGPKRGAGPKRLSKVEWDVIRSSSILQRPNPQ
jgi:hypothetical protein